MKLPGILVAAVLLMAPAAALAVPGIVTTSVSLKAGPGPDFPVVDRIPAGARVTVHGCIKGGRWCEVSWDGERGWVSARYLEYYYRNRYVYLPDYVDVIDVPVVPFALTTYWATYYAGRPWYRRHAYWNNYWRSHERFATVPIGRGGREVERRARTAIAPTAIRPQGFAGVHGAEVRQGHFAHVNGVPHGVGRDLNRGLPGHQPMAGPREGNRFSAAPIAGRPVAGPVAHPNVGRPGGVPAAAQARPQPLAAQGQMGAPRPMGGMPHAGGAVAPHISAPPVSAAPRAGGPVGVRPGGGGPGHHP